MRDRGDLRVYWWPGAGSNRRPSDFQFATGGARTVRRVRSMLDVTPDRPSEAVVVRAAVSKAFASSGRLCAGRSSLTPAIGDADEAGEDPSCPSRRMNGLWVIRFTDSGRVSNPR